MRKVRQGNTNARRNETNNISYSSRKKRVGRTS